MNPIIKIENLSKMYRLGVIGTGTISHDLNRWWYKVRGKEDPYLKIGEANVSDNKSDSGYVWALKDINLEVMPGEVLGIIGKNGAGKSTLLKILSKVTGPTTGSISYRGRIGSLLEVGTGFHPELTGRENIFLNGAILGMTKSEIRRKFDEIVDFAGVERYIDTPVKRYSSGMRVRLGFAVAAFLEPDILVVDEVLAVGDAEFQKKAIGKMQDVSTKDGRTILFVSHNMAAVKGLCAKGIVLKDGSVNFSGTADQAVDYYLTNNQNPTLPLNERTDRFGNGKLKFTNINFYNRNGETIHEIISGDYLKIKLDYTLKDKFKDNKFFFSIVFKNNYDQPVLRFISDELGFFPEIKSNGSIILEAKKYTLRAGSYNVRLLATHRSTQKEDMMDVIENAATLQVLAGDVFKTGKINRPGNDVIIPATYSLQD